MSSTDKTVQEVLDAAELIPALWAEKHGIKTSAGLPFELHGDHRFMRDWFNDLSRFQVLLKPPQIGATEGSIIKSFYVAKKLRKDIIYTLPTASDVNDMAGGKINRIVAQNQIFRLWVRDHDTVEQKAVDENIIYYRGTFSAKQAMMVSSQLNIHDEVDASDQSVITQYETRQQAIADGMRWYMGHPSLAGYGVDVYWQLSDKKEWYVTCPHCEQQQILSWPDSINQITRAFQCKDCLGPLSDADRVGGEWIPTSKGLFSGFHASQLMCPWISAGAILDAKADPRKDEQYFWNYVLGLPYIASENKISSATVLKNLVATANGQEGQVVIGVDTGLPCFFTVANKEGVFFHGSFTNYDELEKLMGRWPDSIVVSDQGGDLIGIRALQEKFPTRVFLCYYRRDRKSKEIIRWGRDKDFGIVTVDRNRMIQLIVESMRDVGRIRINGSREDWADWAGHFDNIYRTMKPEEDSHYGAEFLWERNGPDHYVHSLLYAMVGLDRYAMDKAIILGQGAFDDLPVGRVFDISEAES